MPKIQLNISKKLMKEISEYLETKEVSVEEFIIDSIESSLPYHEMTKKQKQKEIYEELAELTDPKMGL